MQYDATTWKAYIRQTDNATTTAWYGPFGRIDSVKAPDGVRTWTQYDLSDRPLRSKTGSGTMAPTTATGLRRQRERHVGRRVSVP